MTVDAHVEITDPRADMITEREAARAAFRLLSNEVHAIEVLFGDAVAMILRQRLEAVQEKYEDALVVAERALHIADLHNEEPF